MDNDAPNKPCLEVKNVSDAGARIRHGLGDAGRRALIFLGDFFCVGLAALISLWSWNLRAESPIPLLDRIVWFWLLVSFWMLLNSNQYDLRVAASRRATVRGLLGVATSFGFCYALLYFFAP